MATITISDGKLKGGKSKTDSGFEYYEFMGIPYAKPPVGELRFKSPQSPDAWKGERDATSTDPSTISCQVDFLTGSLSGDEDCLYLNVYTPQIPTPQSKPKPVMVLFHGGGFISGNGTLKREGGPDYLIENDVIIVTVNYRLGVLGFLSLELPEVAGNMGLKDQVKSLQWVQNNIGQFGGDKDNVTIFGFSAGSAACEFLLLSHQAKGLFHKAILQSGSSLNSWAINFPKKAKALGVKLARELGYKGSADNLNAMHKVLINASAAELIGAAFKITEKEDSSRVFFGFVPVIEKNFNNGDAFLTETPYTILKEGKFNRVPVIRGFCNNEGSLANMMKPTAVNELIDKKIFVNYWTYPLQESDIKSYNSRLITEYLDKAKPGDESQRFAVKFFGDLDFVAGVYFAGKLQCQHVPVYMYKFSYSGKLNLFKTIFGLMLDNAAHGDDLGYVLRHIALASKIPDETDILLRSRITKMWTNFAKTGCPTPPGQSSELPVWPTFTAKSQEYLNFDKELTIEANYEPEKMTIFEEITKKYEKSPNI